MKETILKSTDITATIRNGEPLRSGCNWITDFFRVNYDKNLAYLMKSKRFEEESDKYELATVNYPNGLQKKLLFLGDVCMHQEFAGKRGGAREGAGRKTKSGGKVSTVSFCAPLEVVELIAREAKKEGVTKSEWIVKKLSQSPNGL